MSWNYIKNFLAKRVLLLTECSYASHRWERCGGDEVVHCLFQSLNRLLFPSGPGSAKELIKSINEKFAGSASWEGTESYPLFKYVPEF